jgi:serine/threonine protein phosphatase PrpC
MHRPAKYAYDAAPAITVGRREQQEDAVAIDFAEGAGLGFVVLADGMGGHRAGDVASRIVVTEMFSELKMLADDPVAMERNIYAILNRAVTEANKSVGHVAQHQPSMTGMGSTLVAPVIFDNRLYWISVGDSPLYLFRGSHLFRLNEEHSLANRMEKLVAQGEMDREEAETHPDRACLTSVLIGSAIPEIDCRDVPIELRDNDILIAASDGLQFIGEQEIARVVFNARDLPSAEIGSKLLQSIVDLDDPDQDNVSFCVLKIADRTSHAGHAHNTHTCTSVQPQPLRRTEQ